MIRDDSVTEPATDVLRLSVHEAAALYNLLGVATPPPLRAMLGVENVEADSTLLALVVQRGLLARGLINVDSDNTVLVVDAVAGLLRLVAMPALVVRVELEEGDALVVRTAYAAPDLAVVETAWNNGILSYEPLDPSELLEFVVSSSRLDARPIVDRPREFSVPVGVLASAGEALAADDADAAVQLLSAAGATADDALAYVDALLRHRVGARGITTVHRVDDVLTTTTTAWTDCAEAGLWVSEQPDAAAVYTATDPDLVGREILDSPIHLRQVSGDEVFRLVRGGFPGS